MNLWNWKTRIHPSGKPVIFWMLWLASAYFFTSCAGTPPVVSGSLSSDTPPEHFVIGLALANLKDPFYQSIRAGAEETAGGINVELIVNDAAGNAEHQAAQLQDLVDRRVDALVVSPVNGEAMSPAIRAANAANIPVLTVNQNASGGQVVTNIASDNQVGGWMAGNFLAKTLKGRGNLVILEGAQGTTLARDRTAGFMEALAAFPSIRVIARQDANFDRQAAQERFAQVLSEQSQVDAVFAENDEMLLGALAAAQQADRSGEILFVGFDGTQETIEALDYGLVTATVAQQPAEIGRLGVLTARQVLLGQSVPGYIPVDLALITR